MTKQIDFKIEKNKAFIEPGQIDPFSPGAFGRLRSCVEQVIKNPAVQTAFLFFENVSPQKEEIKGFNFYGLGGNAPEQSGSKADEQSHPLAVIEKMETIHGREKWERVLDEAHELFHLMENANVSWIAVIQGDCLGWELEQALACDYRIADFNSRFGFFELSLGLIPCFGACIRMPRLTGVKNALDMLLKSRIISARHAQKIGLLDEPAHPLDLRRKARRLAEQIHAGHIPPKPLRKYKPKRFLDKYFEIPLVRHLLYRKTKKRILRKSKNFYPAPLKLLEVIKNTYPAKSLKTALKKESDAFCDLMVSPVTANLLSLCANTEKIHLNVLSAKEAQNTEKQTAKPEDHKAPQRVDKKSPLQAKPAKADQIKKVAVIGAGVMGEGISHFLANRHVPALLKDIHTPSLTSALRNMYSVWNEQSKKTGLNFLFGKSSKEYVNNRHSRWPYVPGFSFYGGKTASRPGGSLSLWEKTIRESKIRPTVDYSGFHNVGLVIETVVEDLEIKKQVIAETASRLSSSCLFATNTSSFRVTELAGAHPDPGRFLGLHFFYPVPDTPLVEVVRGEKSKSSTVSSVACWIRQLGKIPFVVKDRPGFLVHRLFLPLMSEALWCLREGAGIQQVDKLYSAFGFSLGPFRLMDELGLDICLKLIKSFKEGPAFPQEIFRLRPVFLGRKNKTGFYIYNDKGEAEAVNPLVYQDLKLKPSIKVVGDCLQRGIYRMINESAKVLEEQVVTGPAEVDLALILGLGFPAFRGGLLKYADEVSLKTVLSGLNNFSKSCGERFLPSEALLKRADTGQKFY